jgi:non-homologous end joining protein Ku
VKTKEDHFDPSRFDDRDEDALKDLLKKKQEGRSIERRSGGSPQTWSTLWMRCEQS